LLQKKEEKDERRTSSSSSSSSRPGGSADDHEKNDRDGVVPLVPSVPFVFGIVGVVVSVVVVVDLFDGATTKRTAQQQQHAFSVFFRDVIVFCSREEREKVFRVRVVRDDGDVEHRRRDAHVRGFSKHHPETIQEFKKTS
jgi:hypothetical protein